MIRLLRIAALFGLTAIVAPAQDAASPAEELSALRKAVEQQAKQIESLTQQVAKLAAALEGKSAPSAGTATSTEAAPAPAPGKEEFSTTNAPKAEPAQPHHIVVKGETLTSIAKQYNVPLAELIKANKGINDRKIQIGQSILLPTIPTTPTTPPPASEPKPNP